MNGKITELRPPAPEIRLLTAEEIDQVAGGRHNQGGALASAIVNALAKGSSTSTEAVTRTFAITVGDVSIAFGFGFGIAISVGAGSSAGVGVGVTTSATA